MRKGFITFYTVVLVVLIAVFGYFYFSLSSENKRLKENLNSNLERFKIEKDSIINSKQARIDSLTFLNVPLLNQIQLLRFELDSLQTVKQSIMVVYRDKLEEIDSFQNEEILNYWTNEFNQ